MNRSREKLNRVKSSRSNSEGNLSDLSSHASDVSVDHTANNDSDTDQGSNRHSMESVAPVGHGCPPDFLSNLTLIPVEGFDIAPAASSSGIVSCEDNGTQPPIARCVPVTPTGGKLVAADCPTSSTLEDPFEPIPLSEALRSNGMDFLSFDRKFDHKLDPGTQIPDTLEKMAAKVVQNQSSFHQMNE